MAAGNDHSSMQVIRCEDLIDPGIEAAVSNAGKQPIEGRACELQHGDIVVVVFSPK